MADWHGVHNFKVGLDLNPRIKYNSLFDLFKERGIHLRSG